MTLFVSNKRDIEIVIKRKGVFFLCSTNLRSINRDHILALIVALFVAFFGAMKTKFRTFKFNFLTGISEFIFYQTVGFLVFLSFLVGFEFKFVTVLNSDGKGGLFFASNI